MAIWVTTWAVLGRSRRRLGGIFGRSWWQLGRSWGDLGADLEWSWGDLGGHLGDLGTVLGRSRGDLALNLFPGLLGLKCERFAVILISPILNYFDFHYFELF